MSPGGEAYSFNRAGWEGNPVQYIQELQSLVGKLQDTYKVVHPDRTFLSEKFEMLKATPKKQKIIHFNTLFHSDLKW